MSPRARKSALYFLAQGIFVAAWWILVASSPSFAALYFVPSAQAWKQDLFPADALCLIVGSFLTALSQAKRLRLARSIGWLTAGSALYAFFLALTINWPLFQRPLADIGMLFTAAGSIWAAWAGDE